MPTPFTRRTPMQLHVLRVEIVTTPESQTILLVWQGRDDEGNVVESTRGRRLSEEDVDARAKILAAAVKTPADLLASAEIVLAELLG